MSYISNVEKINVTKRQIGTNNGNPIYNEIVEVYCNSCNDKFPVDSIGMGIEFKDGIAVNIKCPNCNEFLK